MNIPSKIIYVAEKISKTQGQGYLVGGAVRDLILGLNPKDFDMEVFGISAKELEKTLRSIGPVEEVGKSFGVYKMRFNEIELDISLPRIEEKTGKGHKDFAITSKSELSVKEAARRRDFTINAIYLDPQTQEINDPYNGQKDLEQKILRVVDSKTFPEDALRVLRALQFLARFELRIEPTSAEVIKAAIPELEHLPKERLLEEWKKLLIKSEKPSLGLQAGLELGVWEKIHPIFIKLQQTPQDPVWHPEGNVWLHTLMVVDKAAQVIRQNEMDEKQKLVVMLGALTHDFGKVITSEEINGRVRAFDHEKMGVDLAKDFLNQLGVDNETTEKVLKIVANHMAPGGLRKSEKTGTKVTDGAIRRLALRLHPATIEELLWVSQADHLGRGPYPNPKNPDKPIWPHDYPAGEWLEKRAMQLDVADQKPKNIVEGRDLLALGFKPGPKIGEMIKEANRLRDEEGKSREEILEIITK